MHAEPCMGNMGGQHVGPLQKGQTMPNSIVFVLYPLLIPVLLFRYGFTGIINNDNRQARLQILKLD